ncbi:glycosyltransferase family A protein [Aestuariivirga sp.]|uniref:glycosyltransferase family A protein n=1 Tax=Aestuariivirga sp. TaxID=2650926 RepID=UPI00391B00F2
MKTALIIPAARIVSDFEINTLSKFRELTPGVTFFLVQIGRSAPENAGEFERTISLPLEESQVDAASCIGMQLALNEGFTSVGTLRSLTSVDLAVSAKVLRELEEGSSDVVVVRQAGRSDGTLFVSQRAAFACSFWQALSKDLIDDRLDIVHQLCQLTNRTLHVVTEKIVGTMRPYVPRYGTNVALAKHASALSRLIGIRIGGWWAPKSSPVSKVAVITPYYKEPASELERCLVSVRNQTYPCDHFMISDGFPSEAVDQSRAIHIKLGVGHSDNGNTPRYVGGLVALAGGYDAIAYLDADNWFESNHIQTLIETQHRTHANAVCSLRNIYLPDGYKLPDCDREDLLRLHVDTSCYLLTHDCEYIAHLWGQMPQSWGPVCDRIVFSALQGMNLAWTDQRTLNFKSNYAAHYRKASRPVPEKTHDIPEGLWRKLLRANRETAAIATSRMGRIIEIVNPYRGQQAAARLRNANAL